MKKTVLCLAVAAAALFTMAACTDEVADIKTSSGGEVVVDESQVGTVTASGEDTDAGITYDSLTITYTDPDGYEKTTSGGGVVTYTLDGAEVGQILYIPATVQAAVTTQFYNALESDAETLRAYAQQYAEDLNADFEATKTTVNGNPALLITGTFSGSGSDGTAGAEAYILIIPMGDQLITLKGIADPDNIEQIKTDLSAFAGSLEGSPASSSQS